MPDRTWFVVSFPNPLIFRYHLPLKTRILGALETGLFVMTESFRSRYRFLSAVAASCSDMLKVPKCEIFYRSDFHYFYTIKPFWIDDFGVKILTYFFKFWGSQASFSFLCASWAYGEGADAYAQHAHQFLTRMLSERISSWCVCSA